MDSHQMSMNGGMSLPRACTPRIAASHGDSGVKWWRRSSRVGIRSAAQYSRANLRVGNHSSKCYARNPSQRVRGQPRCKGRMHRGAWHSLRDFGETYGDVAAGFIHVHHLKPLAAIGTEYEVDPVEDLRPVCPNCHAVVHMTNPPRTVEEVHLLLRNRKMPNGEETP